MPRSCVHLPLLMATLEFRPPMTLNHRMLAFQFVKEAVGAEIRFIKKVCPMQLGAYLHVSWLVVWRRICVGEFRYEKSCKSGLWAKKSGGTTNQRKIMEDVKKSGAKVVVHEDAGEGLDRVLAALQLRGEVRALPMAAHREKQVGWQSQKCFSGFDPSA